MDFHAITRAGVVHILSTTDGKNIIPPAPPAPQPAADTPAPKRPHAEIASLEV
jgi:hypothetical protein